VQIGAACGDAAHHGAGAAAGGRGNGNLQPRERQQKTGMPINAAYAAGAQHHTDAR